MLTYGKVGVGRVFFGGRSREIVVFLTKIR